MSLRILEQDIPGITAKVRELSASQLRLLAQSAGRLAVRSAPVDDHRLARALGALESGTVDPDITEQLRGLLRELDDRAAELERKLDAFGNAPKEEPGADARYVRAFTQARAVEAVIAAFNPDVGDAADDALYEANAALDHAPAAIQAIVEAVALRVDDPVEHATRRMAP